jgi:hypothetical protein
LLCVVVGQHAVENLGPESSRELHALDDEPFEECVGERRVRRARLKTPGKFHRHGILERHHVRLNFPRYRRNRGHTGTDQDNLIDLWGIRDGDL